MIKPEMVPDEVVMKAALELWGVNQPTKWEKDTCRIIIAAALNAWPGAYRSDPALFGDKIILPLPQETRTLVDTVSDEVWKHDASGDNCCATDPQETRDDE